MLKLSKVEQLLVKGLERALKCKVQSDKEVQLRMLGAMGDDAGVSDERFTELFDIAVENVGA